ncbi:LlaJI family restriction endonuclease [Acinetobacter qingfengensis]|uniref:Restriction endonuclease n=1 Tax=Acinetobacter qingfengensis TaxID=1262585 RepID=A0A1E7R8Z7_9GAMM|nr:LlaJI family restriction endonuclease [Acinetobacter qingfengensis]KAA8735535.1 LlaJI family restriction endonuclease [Acinetobacter qingfengensis]OEY95819.1 restriction endonuclease [Acinetobacter qingfengensis]
MNSILAQSEYLTDRMPVEQLPPRIASFIRDKGLVSSVNGMKVSFCGLVCHEGRNYFFFPRKSDIYEILLKPEIYCNLLMQSLLKFARFSRTQVHSPEDGADEMGFDKLELFRYLISDFQQHGIFRDEEILSRKNTGKTDWKRTLNRSVSYPDAKGNPVYLDVFGRQKTVSISEITRIHAGILARIYSRYGFLFGGKNAVPYSLLQYGESGLAVRAQIILLKHEARKHFADRHTLLLGKLIDFLEALKGNQDMNMVIGVTRFHVAWEHMLARCFRNVIDINRYLPKPVFLDNDGNSHIASRSGMRTDIVIENREDRSLHVMDAKYYDATQVSSSPGWSDLVKQFFYEKALSQLFQFEGYQIRNSMIFPGKQKFFDSIKMLDECSRQFQDDYFPPIHCIYIDPLDILKTYLDEKHLPDG